MHDQGRKGGRGRKSVVSTEFISAERVSHARTILRYAPDLADNVLAGVMPLDTAYAEARLHV